MALSFLEMQSRFAACMLQVKRKKTASIRSHGHLKLLTELRIKYLSQTGFCIMTAVAALPGRKMTVIGKPFPSGLKDKQQREERK